MDRVLAARLVGSGSRILALWRQIQQQQRAFGQERLAARGPQVVEHRQQYQCDVPPTTDEAFDIDGQLDHRTGECIQAVLTTFTGSQGRKVCADRFHLFGQ